MSKTSRPRKNSKIALFKALGCMAETKKLVHVGTFTKNIGLLGNKGVELLTDDGLNISFYDPLMFYEEYHGQRNVFVGLF